MFYFDSAGSFPVLEEVFQSTVASLSESTANPSADHLPGEEAQNKIQKVRETISEQLGAMPSEIIFTSGATESNNLAIKGLLHHGGRQGKKHIVTSKAEHKCILHICEFLADQGYEITYLSPDKNGIIEADSVRQAIRFDTALVTIMHVNNELGTINPISDIGRVCFENNVLFHTDAAQSFGKIPINVDDMNIDLLSLSAHKIGGLKGIGALYIRDVRDHEMTPVVHGAGQELGLRGGTLPTCLIEGLGCASVNFPQRYKVANFEHLKQHLTKRLTESSINFTINGIGALPHIVSLTFPEVDVPTFLLSHRSIFAIAQGSACSSRQIEASHVLNSLGLSRANSERTIRFSMDFSTDENSINVFVNKLRQFAAD